MSAEAPTGQLAIPLLLEGSSADGLTPEATAAATAERPAQGSAPSAAEGPSARSLTDEQERVAARRSGSLLLSAGAGSGKTSVLVERFVRSVLDDGVAPGRILAITFTERAAGELRERIRARFVELDRRDCARDTEAAFLGTFHGFCARLLRAQALPAALDPSFAILDEALAARLRLHAFRGALADFLARHGEAGVDLIAAFGVDRVRAMTLDVHAQLRSQGEAHPALPTVSAPASLLEDTDAEGAAACALLDTLLHDFSRRYEELKILRGSLDFDDLELKAGALLHEHPHVRASWSERFHVLMVDEFQDTNPRQLAILTALQRENLFTVGDELQSIYGFRHAAVELFRARRDELGRRGATLSLTRNFRSRPALLAAINGIFATRLGDTYTPLQPGRDADPSSADAPIELLLTDTRTWNEDPTALVCDGLPSAPRWRQAEARLLALRLSQLIHGGEVCAADVAILLRALGDLPLYQRALEERGLRTLAAVGSFWGHQQISDLLAFLRALANPLDGVALYSTLASPLVGLSSDALAHIARFAQSAGMAPWEALCRSHVEIQTGLRAEDGLRLQRFLPRFVSERALAPTLSIAELLRRATADSGYNEHLLALHWGERRLANVHKLLRLARRFEAQEGRDLRGFLDHVAHQQDALAGAEPEAPVGELAPDAVRLMSIHAAKGLEFGVVCLADLGRRPGGASPPLLLDGPRLGLRLARLDGAEATPTLHYSALAEERRHGEAAEEERILYVAATRARERLLLSGGLDFERPPADRPGAPPVAWLAPALLPDLQALAGTPSADPVELAVPGAPWVALRCLLSTPATLGSALREVALLPAPAATEVPTPSAATPGPVPTPAASEVLAPAVPPARPGEDHARTHPIPKKIDLALSCTSLTELERCGYRHYLERLLGLPEDHSALPAGSGLEGRRRGILIHRLLQSLDFAPPQPPSEDDVAEQARQLGLAPSPAERASIVRLLLDALAAPLAQRLARAATPTVRREYPFAFVLAPHLPLVSGVLDLLVRDPSGACLVVDYKSDRCGPDADLEELVERDYSAQRLIYALACLRDGAPSVEILHWFLERPREPVSAGFTSVHIPELERRLLDRAQRALEDPFAVSPTPHRALCLTCPGRATLCSWSDAETLRESPPPRELPPPEIP